MLRSSASSRYNNYNKSHYQKCAEKMVSSGAATSSRLSDSEREKLLRQHHRSTPKAKISEIAYQLPVLSTHAKEVSRLLETTVVSAVIQPLKDDQALSLWVYQGRGLHQERHTDRCLFCDQALPRDRMRDLEAHFSDEYEQFLKSLDNQLEMLEKAAKQSELMELPYSSDFHEELSGEYETAKGKLIEASKTGKALLDALVEEVKRKKGRAFESYMLDTPVPEMPPEILESVNQAVRKHNSACDGSRHKSNGQENAWRLIQSRKPWRTSIDW